jgi:hypothetical protein
MRSRQRDEVNDATEAATGATAASRPASNADVEGIGSRAYVRQALDHVRAELVNAHVAHRRRGSALVLADALAGTRPWDWWSRPELAAHARAAVLAYAFQLRVDGVPAERMLVLVKSVIREAMPPQLDGDEARAFMDDLVHASIRAFFDVAPTS